MTSSTRVMRSAIKPAKVWSVGYDPDVPGVVVLSLEHVIVSMTPDKARALANWLRWAADKAEEVE